MQFHKPTVIANIAMLVGFGLLLGLFGMAGVGAAAVIVGGLNLLLAFIYLIVKNKSALITALLFGGVCLLVGFSLCSAFQLNIH